MVNYLASWTVSRSAQSWPGLHHTLFSTHAQWVLGNRLTSGPHQRGLAPPLIPLLCNPLLWEGQALSMIDPHQAWVRLEGQGTQAAREHLQTAARWPGCWGWQVVSSAAGVPEMSRQGRNTGVLINHESKVHCAACLCRL